MASTQISLPQGVWVKVTTTDKDGYIRHHSGQTKVIYTEALNQPIGLLPTTPVMKSTIMGGYTDYKGVPSDAFVWAYAISANAVLVVTPSDGALANLSLNADYFNGLAAVVVQNYTEANSKLGVQHEGSTLLQDVAAGASNDTIFLTGALPVALKGRIINFDGVGVKGEVYTGATYTGGTPAEYQNASDINPVTGLAQIIVGATVTNDGDLAFAPTYSFGNESNQGKGGIQSTLGGEKLLNPNTAYLLRLTSLDTQTQNISSFLTWYEGELDLPRV